MHVQRRGKLARQIHKVGRLAERCGRRVGVRQLVGLDVEMERVTVEEG